MLAKSIRIISDENKESKIKSSFKIRQDYKFSRILDEECSRRNSYKKEVKSLIDGLKLINQDDFEVRESIQQLQKNNEAHFKKISTLLQKIIIFDEFQQCFDILKKIVKSEQQLNQIVQLNDQYEEQIKENRVCKIELIQLIKQTQYAAGMAFNYLGSIMVGGSNFDIKVWKLEQGKLVEDQTLKGHINFVNCFVFSKKHNWFVSGADDFSIRLWKEQDNYEWISSIPGIQQYNIIICLLLNKNEDQLISCSYDQTIKVRKVNYENNQLLYHYKLEDRHTSQIDCISMNEDENQLVSYGADKQIILWSQGKDQKWIDQSNITMKDLGFRLSYISENSIISLQAGQGVVDIIENRGDYLMKRLDLNIKISEEIGDQFGLFPIIYNKKRQVIILKYNKYVFILRKPIDGKLQLAAPPIDCFHTQNYGSLSSNGELLVIQDSFTQQIRVYRIDYD